ncbi:MAG: hypothetical protein V4647_14190 [Pseudomonadota bacterium]
MTAIAIAALFIVLAAASAATITAFLANGIATGQAIVAELSGASVSKSDVRPVILPPLRSRREVSLPNYSRQAVRLRPLRRSAAAA